MEGSAPWRQSLRSLTKQREALRPTSEAAYWASPAGACSFGVLRIDWPKPGKQRTRACCLAWGFRTLGEADLLASIANVIVGRKHAPDVPLSVYAAVTRPPCLVACRASAHALVVPKDFPLATDLAAIEWLQFLFDDVIVGPVQEAKTAAAKPVQALFKSLLPSGQRLLSQAVAYAFSDPSREPLPKGLTREQWAALSNAALEQVPSLHTYRAAAAVQKMLGPGFARVLEQAQAAALTLPRTMLHATSVVLRPEGAPPLSQDSDEASDDDEEEAFIDEDKADDEEEEEGDVEEEEEEED